MNRSSPAVRATAAALLAIAALAAPIFAGTEEPAPRQAVPADRLPVLGTVGDLPPAETRLVVEVERQGWLTIDGKNADWERFRKLLRARAAAGRDPSGVSTLHLVLRADRDLPWQAVRWIFAECAAPEARVRRVLFAARPEDGGEEGAFAAFLGDAAVPEDARPLDVHLRLWDVRDTMSPWDAYAYMSSISSSARNLYPLAVVSGVPRMGTGLVLETADALLRWGVEDVRLEGPVPDAVPDLERAVKGLPSSEGKLSMVIRGSQIRAFGEKSRRAPPVARLRGRLAGMFAEKSFARTAAAPAATPEEKPVTIAGSPGLLPRIGIVGDLPPESERLVIDVNASGSVAIGGSPVSSSAVEGILGQAARKHADPAFPSASRLHLVLRLDRRLPWAVANRFIVLAERQKPLVNRLLFAAMPEDGGPEGAVAAFAPILVRQGEFGRSLHEERELPIYIAIEPTTPEGLLTRHLLEHLRESRGPWPPSNPWFVKIRPFLDVPVGTVLEVLDMSLRWRADIVRIEGPGDDSRREIRDLVLMNPTPKGGLLLAVSKDTVQPDPWNRRPDPPMPRVKGWMAGLTNPEPVLLIPAPPREPPTEEEDE